MSSWDFTECIVNCCIVETAISYSGPPSCEAQWDEQTVAACYYEANAWCS